VSRKCSRRPGNKKGPGAVNLSSELAVLLGIQGHAWDLKKKGSKRELGAQVYGRQSFSVKGVIAPEETQKGKGVVRISRKGRANSVRSDG